MRRVEAKFVQKLLLENQEEDRKQIATNLLKCSESDKKCLKLIISGDKT